MSKSWPMALTAKSWVVQRTSTLFTRDLQAAHAALERGEGRPGVEAAIKSGPHHARRVDRALQLLSKHRLAHYDRSLRTWLAGGES